MFLVELVMQGIRGFRELVRLRFQSGFNFVAAGNEAGKTTAVETVQRLLFPDSHAGLIETLISRHTPDASRGALVFFSNDGAYYRIIQDFSKRVVNLSKYDTGAKDFGLLHKDWDRAATFMAGLTTGMSEEDFAKVFIFRREQYAGLRGASGPTPIPAPRMQPGKPAAPAARKTGTNEGKLAELREALKKAEESADAEYKAQSAKLALDEIRKKLASLEEIEQKRHDLVSKIEELKGCEALPEDLPNLLETHERLQGQKSAEAEELNNQLSGLKAQLENLPTVDLMKDKWFLAGAVLGVVSFLAGVFVLTSAQLIYLYVGLLLAMGLMAAAGYKSSRSGTQHKTIMQDIEALEKDRLELGKRSDKDKESAAIQAFMKSTGAATSGELKDKADSYRYLLSLRGDIEEQRQRIVVDRPPEMLQQEYNKLQQEALELEKAARAVAQNNIDTYALRQEIERIEAESTPGAAWDFSAEAQDLPVEFSAPPTSSGQVGFHTELGIASRIGGIELETLVPAVEAAAQRNLLAITNGRYVRIEVGHDGGPPVVHARDDSVVQYAELSHGTRDLIYFCLRTGLVEALAGKVRLPLLLDDPLAGFDAARQKAACQILRVLGAKTQVILFSSNPALKAEGDVAVELK